MDRHKNGDKDLSACGEVSVPSCCRKPHLSSKRRAHERRAKANAELWWTPDEGTEERTEPRVKEEVAGEGGHRKEGSMEEWVSHCEKGTERPRRVRTMKMWHSLWVTRGQQDHTHVFCQDVLKAKREAKTWDAGEDNRCHLRFGFQICLRLSNSVGNRYTSQ